MGNRLGREWESTRSITENEWETVLYVLRILLQVNPQVRGLIRLGRGEYIENVFEGMWADLSGMSNPRHDLRPPEHQ